MKKPLSPVQFTDADLTMLGELLRIAQQTLIETTTSVDKVWPGSALGERMTAWAESAADLRERIDGR